jgi:hypothetical protein
VHTHIKAKPACKLCIALISVEFQIYGRNYSGNFIMFEKWIRMSDNAW